MHEPALTITITEAIGISCVFPLHLHILVSTYDASSTVLLSIQAVGLKGPSCAFDRTSEDVEDVRREVQIMHHLKGHPNITFLKGAFEDRSNVHLVCQPISQSIAAFPLLHTSEQISLGRDFAAS